ncbi:unnamed protein product, partial [Heterosigma akashiwo]
MGGKKIGKYEIGKTIGYCAFGKVKSATNTKTGEQVALKVLDKSAIQKENMERRIKKEISIMKMTACHPNVARFIEVLSSRTKICIVLEMVTGGELLDKIADEYEGRFSEDKARFYFRQLLAGVEYCHARRGHHLNLRPDSLLLDKDGNLKILYFRLSALCSNESDEGLLQNTSGTPNYVAPEVLTGRGYDGQKADLWTCGVILYALLAGFLPFDESSQSRLFKKITAADFSYPPWFSQEVRRLLGQIMTSGVGSRLAILQMKEDPWITLG